MTYHDLDWSDVEADAQRASAEAREADYDYPDEDPEDQYPVGHQLPCYDCQPHETTDDDGNPASMRECVELGPVVNRADPTQSYKLSCGHLAI